MKVGLPQLTYLRNALTEDEKMVMICSNNHFLRAVISHKGTLYVIFFFFTELGTE